MPTPFQHLVYAQRVLHHPTLPMPVRDALHQELGAYLLGTTAADVQVITGQARVETHFYRISTGPNGSPVEKMLATFGVDDTGGPRFPCSPAHAAFLAGYAVHLVWDEIWAWDIFVPTYRDGDQWPDRKSLFVHHNALRIWLDRQAYALLRDVPHLPATLASIHPENWLPFAPDGALVEWRDWLVMQLRDPDTVQTTQVFAERLQVPIAHLSDLVVDLSTGVYATVPALGTMLQRYEDRSLTASIEMLSSRLPDWSFAPMLSSVSP